MAFSQLVAADQSMPLPAKPHSLSSSDQLSDCQPSARCTRQALKGKSAFETPRQTRSVEAKRRTQTQQRQRMIQSGRVANTMQTRVLSGHKADRRRTGELAIRCRLVRRERNSKGE